MNAQRAAPRRGPKRASARSGGPRRQRTQSRSMIVALAMPPPSHIVCSP